MLRRHLALIALEGRIPWRSLSRAAAVGELDDARAPAAVLDWRLSDAGTVGVGPLFWLDPIPDSLAADPTWVHTSPREPISSLIWPRAYAMPRASLGAEAFRSGAVHFWITRGCWPKSRCSARLTGVDPADSRMTGPQQYSNRSLMAQKPSSADSTKHSR